MEIAKSPISKPFSTWNRTLLKIVRSKVKNKSFKLINSLLKASSPFASIEQTFLMISLGPNSSPLVTRNAKKFTIELNYIEMPILSTQILSFLRVPLKGIQLLIAYFASVDVIGSRGNSTLGVKI